MVSVRSALPFRSATISRPVAPGCKASTSSPNGVTGRNSKSRVWPRESCYHLCSHLVRRYPNHLNLSTPSPSPARQEGPTHTPKPYPTQELEQFIRTLTIGTSFDINILVDKAILLPLTRRYGTRPCCTAMTIVYHNRVIEPGTRRPKRK